MERTELLVLLMACCLSLIFSYNVDTQFPIIFEKPAETYFGYTTALYRVGNTYWLLVGAPRANRSNVRDLVEPGVLYKCNIFSHQECEEVEVDTKDNVKGTHNNQVYWELKHNSWLGVSLDVSENEQIVTCAHRWINQFDYKNAIEHNVKPKMENYQANGACYLIEKDLNANSTKKLLPLLEKDKQVVKEVGPRYVFGMVGMAAHFPEASEMELMLGAPGIDNWDGNMVPINNPTKSDRTITWSPRLHYERYQYFMYFGYAISSGKFFHKDTSFQYLIGAPRYQYTGKVYVIGKTQRSWDIMSITKTGKQLGEYFGAALCATDLNQDGLSDMIIGAPFHAVVKDEGIVYVYINKGRSVFSDYELTGSGIPGARFGSAITCLNDINGDRLNDIAIGAPFENDHGAVYIYYGYATEPYIDLNNVQRIVAKEFNTNLRGFGISISKSRDIDRNNHPDIAVGSFESGHAVVLRSRIVASLDGSLTMYPNKINRTAYGCTYQGVSHRCFQVESCISFVSTQRINQLYVLIELFIDSHHRRENPRGNILDENKLKSKIAKTLIPSRRKACYNFTVYLREDIKDYLSPLTVDMKFDIDKQSKPSESFCNDCPVLDPQSKKSVSKQIIFITGCGSSQICHSDLRLEGSIVNGSTAIENPILILGLNRTLTMNITVSNDGQEAFQTELKIVYPEKSRFINLPTSCGLQMSDNYVLCDIANPLSTNKMVSLQFIMEVIHVKVLSEFLIQLSVTTGSAETNTENNEFQFVIPIKLQADITIYGSTPNEYIREVEKANNSEAGIKFSHNYEVRNLGPSPLKFVKSNISIPTNPSIKDAILNISEVKVTDGSISGYVSECRGASVKHYTDDGTLRDLLLIPEQVRRRRKRSTKAARQSSNNQLNCETITCHNIECDIYNIAANESIKIEIEMFLKQSKLKEIQKQEDSLEIITEGHVKIQNSPPDIQPVDHKPDSTTVKSIFDSGKVSESKLPMWVIPVSIILGVILLGIIFAVFYKVGFFKRNQRDKLNELKRASQMIPPNQETGDIYNSQNNLIDSQSSPEVADEKE